MDEPKERHSKRKASRHDEEGKRKKKHHKEEQDSKSKKKDRHKAIKVVDDDAEDDEMWVEHNIDVDGQHVSCRLGLRRDVTLNALSASDDDYPDEC